MSQLGLVRKEAARIISLRAYSVRRRAEIALWRLTNRGSSSAVPRKPGPVLVHLGCGEVESSAFINVDAKPGPNVDVVADVRSLSMFSDSSVDLVYACHVLEHFPEEEQRNVLWEWKRILKKGGVLRLSVPDFDKLLQIYEHCDRDVGSIVMPLMGYDDGYRGHCYIFNETYLTSLLCEVGFKEARQWDPKKVEHHDFDDWASRPLQRGGEEFHISLNLEGIA